ncbi:uncharacterized protein [Venturia canescens]|uniref:uncharacterized protein n=1 Tax=Venturia canescens TaxID=32260 RepID=UPI001C9BE8DA|nr:uncharacterized protein LOC122413127 [Venturia canescens]
MQVIKNGHKDLDEIEKKRSRQINNMLQRLDTLENRAGVDPRTNGRPIPKIEEFDYARPLSCNEIEIGAPRSNVIITQDRWYIAKSKASFSAAGLSLLTAVFPMQELLKCNLEVGQVKFQNQRNISAH